MTVYVLACDEANYNASAGTCSAPYYAPQQTLLPQLSAADGATISVAIAAVWVIGFAAKEIRRSIRQRGE